MSLTGFTFRGVQFDVMNVQPWSYTYGQDESGISVTYQTAYADRFVAKRALLGQTTRKTAPTGDRKYLERLIPHQWPEPDYNTQSRLYCRRARILGLETTTTANGNYNYATIEASYTSFPYDFVEDGAMVPGAYGTTPDEATLQRYVEYGDRETDCRVIHGFGLGAIFCDPPSDTPNQGRGVQNGAIFPFYEETLTYIWHQVPAQYAPIEIATGMINKINNAPFDVYTARTLMVVGVKPRRTTLSDQTRAFNIEYRIKHNPKKWDHLPDPLNNMRWDKVVSSADPSKILFDEDDFGKLFRPI